MSVTPVRWDGLEPAVYVRVLLAYRETDHFRLISTILQRLLDAYNYTGTINGHIYKHGLNAARYLLSHPVESAIRQEYVGYLNDYCDADEMAILRQPMIVEELDNEQVHD